MGIIKKIKNYFYSKKLNKRISQYKYVHIMFNDKFNKPFVDFINRNFDKKEHVVLCKRWFDEHPFPTGENVIEIKNLKGVDFNCNEKLICHSLFDLELVDYLYRHQNILKNKAYWMIWGGDLYNAPCDKKNDFVRANFKGYISDTDGDCEVATKTYGSNPETYDAGYTFPITKEMLDSTHRIEHDYIQIQINNSADKTTLEMLDILSKFKDENIKIATILSYGQLEFKEEIIRKGKEIFGVKFEYLDKYLTPSEYAQFLAQNDILILNQNRQQGIGNCFSNLTLGSKVFIKSEITTYNHFNSKGIKVFDTNEIKNMTFEDFISYTEEIKQTNMQKALMFFDDTYLKELWKEVFEKSIDTIKYWSDRAKKYGKHSVYNMTHSLEELDSVDSFQTEIYLKILKKYLTGNETTAIDFGCGPGRFEPMLSELVKEKVYAIDPILSLINLAPKIEKVEYILLDKEKIDLPDNSVDLIFCSLVLGGITNNNKLKKIIVELKRIAKPNALFFIVENTAKEDNSNYWHYRSVDEYLKIFKPINLKLIEQYEDVGEEISILVGRNF